MYDQLINEDDRPNGEEAAFKVVKVRLGESFLSFNDNLNEPVFTKRCLFYDKYELKKLISYQQFQMLFRPFKKNPTFKDSIRWWKIFIGFGVFYILLTIAMLFLFDPKKDKTNEIIFSAYVVVFSIILIVLAFRYNAKMSKVKSQLKEFCQILNSQQNDVSFRMVKIKMQKVGENQVEAEVSETQKATISKDYIYVQSKRVREDNQYIKLYKKPTQSIQHLCSKQDSPIYREEQFSFDKLKLSRFITFDQFQLLLRPFKANYLHRRMLFWQKFVLVSIASLFLLFVPLLIWDDGQKDFTIIIVSYAGLVQFLVFFGMFKVINKQSEMLVQFKGFCEDLSRSHPTIEIILHMKDKKPKTCGTINQLYCFEIKSKQQARNIMD